MQCSAALSLIAQCSTCETIHVITMRCMATAI
jgi:hypothetical protein